MKVCLVFPRLKYQSGDPPLGIAHISAYLKKTTDAEVTILDLTFSSMQNAMEFLRREKPDLVGIYTDTLMFNDAVRIAKFCRHLGIFTVAGGPHASILPETLTDNFNLVIVGEGELAFSKIVKNFKKYKSQKKSKIINGERVKDLDELGFPDRSGLDMKQYIRICHPLDGFDVGLRCTGIIASRGCPYNCSFCQPTLRTVFGDTVRKRSPENVIEELRFLKKRYRINSFFFQDDTLTADTSWVERFCTLLKQSKLNMVWSCNTRADLKDAKLLKLMHSAGLRVFHVGVESGSQRVLNKIYRKGIKLANVRKSIDDAKAVGIITLCFFMLGAPTETKKEIKKTIRFAVSLNATEITATIATPLPKTHLYEMMKDNYTLSNDFCDFDYYNKRAFEDKKLTFKELKRYQLELLFRFYTHPKRWGYILRHFTSVKGLKKMMIKIKRFV